MNREFKKGDKVRITDGLYEGQTGTIDFIMGNGAMVERDVDTERRFCPVAFEHMEALVKNKQP